MSVLVTDGAGFIGSNFVLGGLAQCDEPVINLDALTYAGNLENLSSLQGDARHCFVKGDIGDARLVSILFAEHQPRSLWSSTMRSQGSPCRFRVADRKYATGCTSRTIAPPSVACSMRAGWARPATWGGWNEKANLDVVHTLCAMLDELQPRADGLSYATQITFVKDRPGHDRRYAIGASKLERELGWKPAETFETGIRKTVCWYLDNQDWVRNVASGSDRHWMEKQYA